MSWHSLRHSFGTWAVARGSDLRSLQEAMGHESLTTTEIYTQVNATRLRGVMETMGLMPGKGLELLGSDRVLIESDSY